MDATFPSRAPLDVSRVRDGLAGAAAAGSVGPVGPVTAVGTTGSTNTDIVDAFRADPGLADRTVVLAEEQVAARGRLGRPWSAPAGAQVILSIALRPDSALVREDRFGELPLFIGVAVAETARRTGVDAALKWPNDVIVNDPAAPHGYRKLAGILVEAVSLDPAVVVAGIGLNVSITDAEFAEAGLDAAASLTTQGADVTTVADREDVAVTELTNILSVDAAWRAGGEALEDLRRRYRELSVTLGTTVRAELPDGSALTGTAVDLDERGGLVIRTGDGDGATLQTVTAGDVVHLRPHGSPNPADVTGE